VNVSGSLASGWTMGAAAGASQTATPASTTVPEPANSILLSVDHAIMPTAVSIAAGTYNTPSALVTAIQSAIDQTNLKGRVTVGLDSTGNALTFSSDRSGRLSSVQVSGALASSTLNMPGTVGTATNAGFSINSPTSYTSTTSQTVYDSLGNAHNLSMYFVKTATDNVWDVYTSLDGGFPPEIDPVSGTHTPWTVNFGTDGILKSPTSATKSYALSNGATSPLAFTIDLKGTTEFGNSFGINQLTQDGYTTGKLSGLSVSGDGIITGRFSNGQARNMGQLQLVSFQNPNGLQSLGNNQWGASSTSGAAQPNVPGSGILGAIQSGSVEDSNVDLTAELVDMITQQRAYQANAQSIKTQDQLLQTLVNLR
ncbi:MAG: flagellar hook-basal body complex protein, partial [Zoogloea sp.]|nr:flagellar hook-basal body complex protein [Zoogloea sp.]